MPLSLCFLFQCLVVVRGFISPIFHRCLCPVPQYKKPLRDVHLLLLLRMELMGLHALFLDKGLGAGLSLVWFGSGFWFFLFYFYINRWWIWSLSSTLLLNLIIIIIIIIVLNPLDRMCLFFWKQVMDFLGRHFACAGKISLAGFCLLLWLLQFAMLQLLRSLRRAEYNFTSVSCWILIVFARVSFKSFPNHLCNIPSFRNCNYYCFFLVISLPFCFFFLNMVIIF